MPPLRHRLEILSDQDPNTFPPLSRLRSEISELIYPHPDLSQGVSRPQAIHTTLALLTSLLDDAALLHPPLPNPQDLQEWWPLLYPYTDPGPGGCMIYNNAKVKVLSRLSGLPKKKKRVWQSGKRSLYYLAIKLGRGIDPPPSRKKPSIITSAHRLIYWCFYGPFMGQVLHCCGNSKCYNPNHLKEGDHLMNYHDWAMM
jgi:hypothetical protein